MADILKFYGTDLKISGPLKSVPLEWFCPEPSTFSKKLLRVITDPRFNKSIIRKSYMSTATVLLILAQGAYHLCNTTTETKKSLLLPCMLILILTASMFYFYVCRAKAVEIAELINGFIQFDKMYPKNAKKLFDLPILQMFGMAMAKVIFLSQIVVPIGAVFGFHIHDPWKPSLAGFWLIAKTENESEIDILVDCFAISIKIVVLLYNYLIWNLLISSSVFVVGMLYNICTGALIDCIKM